MWEIIAVGWTGQNFSGEQMLALRNAAAQHMRLGKKGSTFEFKHESCEGQITRHKSGVYNGFSGTFFHADLGTVDGERWTMDFLIPYGTERSVIGKNDVVLMSRMVSTAKDKEPVEVREVVQGNIADVYRTKNKKPH